MWRCVLDSSLYIRNKSRVFGRLSFLLGFLVCICARKNNRSVGYTAQHAIYSFETNASKEPFITSTQLRFGRIINENKQHWLYPSVGIGTTAIILYPYSTSNEKSSNSISHSSLTPSFDIGINEDILIDKAGPDKKSYGGLILGLRAGYHTSVRSNNWRDSDGNKLHNMPSYSNNYFYLTVSFGAGGFAKK